MSDKLYRISTPTIKYTIDDEFDMSRIASSRFIICNIGDKNRIVKENPIIEDMSFRVDLTQEETQKLNAGTITAQIHILLNNHKVIWTDIAKTTMNGVLGTDSFDVPDYSSDTGEYEIDFHGTVSDYDVPLHGHLDVTLEGSVVIPNPEGEATEDLTKVEIDGEIFLVKDSTIYEWARAEEKPTYTKAEVGLGNVDNTSDTDKPISTATRNALDGKVDNSQLGNYYTKSEVNSALDGKVDKDGDKVLSDNNYSDTDKTKLDGIEANANHTEVDTEISSTSENPLQNKVIYDLLNDLLPEGEATGNPISISNASGFNAKALTIDMLPIQEGSGTPSPDNVRTISGRNSLDITVNGETKTVNLGQTVYGGTCDVVNGRTSVEWEKRTFLLSQADSKTVGTTNTRYWFQESTYNFGVNVPERARTICSIVEYQVNYNDTPHIVWQSQGATFNIYVPNELPTSTSFEICYPKATPTIITTPSTSISLEKGNNTLSTNGDNIDMKYSTTISNPTTLSMGNPFSLASPLSLGNTLIDPEVEEEVEELTEEQTE